jgi:leucyl-tRNA synthetase
MDDFSPDGSGRGPLGRINSFLNTTCGCCGAKAKRETDTMGGFACSSWYFLRFTNPSYQNGPYEPKAMQYWMPVDLYVGGAEHAVLHLLYARFWTKFLADEGLLDFREPFTKLINQGQLHGQDGKRMSKSRGNVVVPDEIISIYGADALRLYCLFMAPFDNNVDWNTEGINGVWRFLNRLWRLYELYWLRDVSDEDETNKNDPRINGDIQENHEIKRQMNQTIKAVTKKIEEFQFNTMVSELMEFVNLLYAYIEKGKSRLNSFRDSLEILMLLIAPSAPYIAEELWVSTGHSFSIHEQSWPGWDDDIIRKDIIEIPVQVNGKKRGLIMVPAESGEAEAISFAKQNPKINEYLVNLEISRVVFVPGKILSIITSHV